MLLRKRSDKRLILGAKNGKKKVELVLITLLFLLVFTSNAKAYYLDNSTVIDPDSSITNYFFRDTWNITELVVNTNGIGIDSRLLKVDSGAALNVTIANYSAKYRMIFLRNGTANQKAKINMTGFTANYAAKLYFNNSYIGYENLNATGGFNYVFSGFKPGKVTKLVVWEWNISNPEFNLSVYNTSFVFGPDGTDMLDTWDARIYNSTHSRFLESTTGFKTYNYSWLPKGQCTITIWRNDGYPNATYRVNIQKNVLTNLKAFIFHQSQGSFNASTTPKNNTNLTYTSMRINVTFPLNISYLFNISYKINNGALQKICTNCKNNISNITIYAFGKVSVKIRVASSNSTYPNYWKNFTINRYFGIMNISIFNEMTGKMLNFSRVNKGKITFFCTNRTYNYTVTSARVLNLNIFCEPEIIKLDLNYTSGGNYWRTLMPPAGINNLSFYMIDLVNDDAVLIYLYKKDPTNLYQNSKIVIEKVIDGVKREIIAQKFDVENKVILYLVKDERYTIKVVGMTRTVSPGFLIADSSSSRNLWLSNIPFVPTTDSIYKDVRWGYDANKTTRVISFNYVDTLGLTTYLKFWIYNASNQSQLLFYDDANDTSSAIFMYAVPLSAINTTFLLSFEAMHGKYGLIKETKSLTFYGAAPWLPWLPIEWKTAIAMFVIIFTALLIGAWDALRGAVICSVEAGLFLLVGMLPPDMTLVVLFVIILSVLAILAKRGKPA